MPFVIGYAPAEGALTREKDDFWNVLYDLVNGVPSGDEFLVLMDANVRTGKRENGCADGKGRGAYGRDELDDNGERLLFHATDDKLALEITFFAEPYRGVSYTSQTAHRGKGQYQPAYILTR